jgi:peptide/nickel transport system substrate-binding protein
MLDYFRFSWQRRLRRGRVNVRRIKLKIAKYLGHYVVGKKRQLIIVRRFVILWVVLPVFTTAGVLTQLAALKPYYSTTGPLSGGHFIEGSVGEVKLINPILPEGGPSADVARLVFSGLLRRNPDMQLEGDLAADWSISTDNKTYSFKLRRDIKWHDGVPFTARDVVFTLAAIQNPDSRSPLAASWNGVRVEARDDYTVTFTLPSPYSAFLESLLVGILPSHLLESSDPSALRIASFNQRPIGTGPFRLRAFDNTNRLIELEAYPDYHHGKPQIDRLTFRFYENHQQLIDAYAKRQVMAISRWPAVAGPETDLPNLRMHYFYLPDQVNLFFRTTQAPLNDQKLRHALALAIDRDEIVGQLSGQPVMLRSPLIPGQLGYEANSRQPGYDRAAAERLLSDAGWAKQPNGVRSKNGQTLRLSVVTLKGDYETVANVIRRQWAAVGVELEVKSFDNDNLQQSYIRPRNYDLLLYGITIGADPDVYVYWHSSQANDPGLNLSQYSSPSVDRALESGRISADPQIRKGKYQTFTQSWLGDYPALILYQPTYIYAASDQVLGVSARRLGDPTDRYYGVEKWTVRTRAMPLGRR